MYVNAEVFILPLYIPLITLGYLMIYFSAHLASFLIAFMLMLTLVMMFD